jgi:GTP pyrophosphokinase
MIAEEHVNMVAVTTQERDDRTTVISLTIDIQGIDQLSRLLSKLETVRGVISVARSVSRAGKRAS